MPRVLRACESHSTFASDDEHHHHDDKATSETYGLNSLYNDKTGSTAFTRSRYQDRWSKRNGRWAIDHRQDIVDFRTTSVETGAKTVVMGKRVRTDASYAIVPF